MDKFAYIRSILKIFQNFIYPARCLVCGAAGHNNQDLCISCSNELPWIKTACIRCALPLADNTCNKVICGRCLQRKPFFDSSMSLFVFEKDCVKLIHQLKFHEKLAVARLLGHLLLDGVKTIKDMPDCLVPVPLHYKRLKQRGFNQSIEIARPMASYWGIPIKHNIMQRVIDTQSQTDLDAKARKRNIKGVFKLVGDIKYKHVAIVDDVVTTGSTVNEMACVLKKAGVEKVSVYSVARAPLK